MNFSSNIIEHSDLVLRRNYAYEFIPARNFDFTPITIG